MIDFLSIGRSAYFFNRKKRISNAAIQRLFREVRDAACEPTRNLFRVIRTRYERALYSAICFSYARDASFLAPPSGAVERVYGYLLIVEHGNHVALFKSGLDLTSEFKSNYLTKVSSKCVEAAIAQHGSVFEKLRLRNMSVSPLALKSKTLEARDLENAVATSSASRFVPQGYSVNRADGLYSATPTTGRISVRSERTGFEQAIAWASEISTLLAADDGEVSPFIRNFARPLELLEILPTVLPTYVGMDVMGLADRLFSEHGGIRLVRAEQDDAAAAELTQVEAEAVLEVLDQIFTVAKQSSAYRVMAEGLDNAIGSLKFNSNRISLKLLKLPEIAGLFVEQRDMPVGGDPDAMPFAKYLDREDLFTVLFSDLALAYIDGDLYRDEALAGGGEALLSRLQVEPGLANVTSEKGTFAEHQTVFANRSVFHVVVNDIAKDDVLICDDLGDEWADFIGVSTSTNPVMISFYHAKHGPRSLSASAFHESVGQAIKNLGRMTMPVDDLSRKLVSWDKHYRNDGVQTQIHRMLKGGGVDDVTSKINDVRTAPDVLPRVFIVTSSLSRSEVDDVFKNVEQGISPSPHFVQLYWLLMSYFSACSEVGVRGYVVCQP